MERPKADESTILDRAGRRPSFLYKESSWVWTEPERPNSNRSYISESLGSVGSKPSFDSQYKVQSRNQR